MQKEFDKSRFLPPADLFDYMERFIDALEHNKFKSIREGTYLIDEDYIPGSPARDFAVSMMANYLILGLEHGDPRVFGSIVRPHRKTATGYEGMIIDDAALRRVDFGKVRERLNIIQDFFRIRDLRNSGVNYDWNEEVAFGPVPEEYLPVMELLTLGLNYFVDNPAPNNHGQLYLRDDIEPFKGEEVGGEFVLIAKRQNAHNLLHVGRFDPYQLVRVPSAFGDFKLDAWAPDMRPC